MPSSDDKITLSNANGLWFCGLSGVGKTFASQYISEKINRSFIIDGDFVRKTLSADLGYTEEDRKIQIRRLLNISKIVLENEYFPLISTVFMDKWTLDECRSLNIRVIQIERPLSQIEKIRPIYQNAQNVVGVDIKKPELNLEIIQNSGNRMFFDALQSIIKSR